MESAGRKPEADVFRFVPYQGSDRLVIFFSGVHSRNFTGYRLMAGIPVNCLFIRDTTGGWYNGPIPHLCRDADDLLVSALTSEMAVSSSTSPGHVIAPCTFSRHRYEKNGL